jgi:3-hydroxyacyl-CoA dehydrogenase
MFQPFRKVVIAGAGVMGAQIAANFLNIGAEVSLLDIRGDDSNPNGPAQKGWAKALKLSPPILTHKSAADRIRLGNTTDNLDWLSEADLFLEAIPEVLEWKQALFEQAEPHLRPGTVIGSNTSGKRTIDMLKGRSKWFRENFLVIHFFNPPRYMKLLELVPGPETKPAVLERVAWFAETYWGKGIVRAKDTPDFIGNRIGVFNLMQCIRAYTDGEFTIEEIDAMRGTVIGCQKSAIFRTADVVGLPVVKANVENMYAHLPEDECRALFELPAVIQALIDRGDIGATAKAGFYKKVRGEIQSLDLASMQYQTPRQTNLPGLQNIAKLANLKERLVALYELEGRVGDFFRRITLQLLAYCANRIPEIADKPEQIDNAMRWGYGWELGPFQIWEVLGFERICNDIQNAGHTLAPWVAEMRENDNPSFFSSVTTQLEHAGDPQPQPNAQSNLLTLPLRWCSNAFAQRSATSNSRPVVSNSSLTLETITNEPGRVVRSWTGGTLYDIGDQVTLFSFNSKANAIGVKVVDAVLSAIEFIEDSEWKGMVVANKGPNFSVGANLVQVLMALSNPITAGRDLPEFLGKFQQMTTRLATSAKPIVPFVQGLALGGGAEFMARCPMQVLHQDAMGGLVEVGVGLIPAGTGATLMAQVAAERASGTTPNEVLPYLIRVHEQMATAETATGAKGLIQMGLAKPNAHIVPNVDDGIQAAKYLVLGLSVGYMPPVSLGQVYCLGEDARIALQHRAYVMHEQGLASEHDVLLANSLAEILTGGEDHKVAGYVSADSLLESERRCFLDLLNTEKTRARIAHMLKTNKPLRN